MILRHLGGVYLKKNFLLRIDEEVFDKVKDISEVEERSINYMMCKLIDKGLNCIDLGSEIEKEIHSSVRELKNEYISIANPYLEKYFGV